MQGLERGINLIATQETNKSVRDHAVHLLDEIIADIKSGIEVWNGYLSNGDGTEKGLFGGWAGSDMEAKLFNIHLQAREKAMQASKGEASLDDSLIEQAYVKLTDDQTGKDAAQQAVNTMQNRIDQIKRLIEVIRKTKPSKPKSSAAPAVKQTSAKQASAKKKTKTKAKPKVKTKTKVAAKKASAKKTASKQKTSKKKAAKKAAKKSVKKAAKKSVKKAVKKKTTAKKAAKKATKKKSAAKKKTAKRKK